MASTGIGVSMLQHLPYKVLGSGVFGSRRLAFLNRRDMAPFSGLSSSHFGESVKLGRVNDLRVECLICMNGLHGITSKNSLSKIFNAGFHYHETIVTGTAVAFLDCQLFPRLPREKDFICVLWRKQGDCTLYWTVIG